ncbi:MAG: glycosyl transferase [Acidobacteria bacterium]|nr:glycosyl transferase [Acidobacteriota bacterium]
MVPYPTIAAHFLTASATSLVLVWLCRTVALRLGCVAQPGEDRWHSQPTALFGGVAIGVTVFGCLALVGDAWQPAALLVCAASIFIVGLVDDVQPLKPFTKLIIEIALASVLLFFDYRLDWTGSLTVDSLLTVAWIVGITNAFNLLDNMDGLCAGVALIAGVTLLTALRGDPEASSEAVYLTLLLGAIAGFLVYNFHPASIFMGDSGSLFIGLSLAALTLSAEGGAGDGSNVLTIVLAPALVLLVPIFDTTLVTLSRLRSGRSAAEGGRDHSSHRLVAIGLSERVAVAVLWTLAALAGLIGLAVRAVSPDWAGLLAAIFVLAMVIFAVYLAQVRVYEDVDETTIRSGAITPFVVNFVYKRRIAEVLLDVCLVSIAYYAAYRLRFEGLEYLEYFPSFLESLPVVLGVQMVTLYLVGGYRGVWRYFGLMDGVVFAKSVMFGTLSSVFIIVFVYRFESYSRGVFVVYAALLMLSLIGSRASFRLISEFVQRRRHTGERLVIYGAGDGGAVAVRELLSRPGLSYKMVGFIDDDSAKQQARIQGYPVVGDYEALAALVSAAAVDRIVISTRAIDSARLQKLEALCGEHGVGLSRFHFDFEDVVTVS